MQSIKNRLNALIARGQMATVAREEGQGTVEYVLIIGLVSIALVVAATALDGTLATAVTAIGDKLGEI